MMWLENGFEKNGLEYFVTSRRLLKEVWERQDEPTSLLDLGLSTSGGSKAHTKSSSDYRTWVDESKGKGTWVILF